MIVADEAGTKWLGETNLLHITCISSLCLIFFKRDIHAGSAVGFVGVVVIGLLVGYLGYLCSAIPAL